VDVHQHLPQQPACRATNGPQRWQRAQKAEAKVRKSRWREATGNKIRGSLAWYSLVDQVCKSICPCRVSSTALPTKEAAEQLWNASGKSRKSHTARLGSSRGCVPSPPCDELTLRRWTLQLGLLLALPARHLQALSVSWTWFPRDGH
jgi:hypothetical protein